jgi:hypothetical protein
MLAGDEVNVAEAVKHNSRIWAGRARTQFQAEVAVICAVCMPFVFVETALN